MKLHQGLIVATLSLSVLVGNVGNTSAQDSEGLKFGKGRLLKKMRDDIFGSKPKFKLPSFKPKATPSTQGFSYAGNKNVPTPALPTKGNYPTPIDAKSAYKSKAQQSPTPASQARKSYTIKSKSPVQTDRAPIAVARKTSVAPKVTRVASKTSVAPKTALTPEQIQSVTRSAKKSTLAFGMLLETRGKNLVVTQVDPAGNANKAGVRKGDMIVGGGGVDFGSMYEFNDITGVLQDGDQLEFVVSQNGKKAKKLIAFGDVPDVRSVASNGSATRTAPARTATASNLGQYQIAPADSRMQSVIESRENQITTTPAQATQPSWKYSSGRRNQQLEAVESAANRGETILNLPN